MYTTWRIDYTPFKNNTWDDNDMETLESFYDPLIRMTLGDGKDSFSFKVTNFNNRNNGKFNPLDRIQIYRTVNTDSIDTTTDILMVGSINDSPDTDNNKSNMSTVKGYNYSEAVMSAIVFLDATPLRINEALERALKNAGNRDNFEITWHPDNPDKLSDEVTEFPYVQEQWYHWTLLKILDQYSSNEYTGDGNYYWYVDNDNRLVWRQRDSTTLYTFDSSVDAYLDLKSSKDKSGIKNYIIAKGGFDPAGTPIQTYYQDAANIAKNGKKYHLLIGKNGNGGAINKADLEDSWGPNNYTDKYPDFSVDFTTTWQSSITDNIEGISMVEGQKVTILSSEINKEEKYRAILRAHVKGLLKKEAKMFVDNRRNGINKIDLTFKAGTKSWGLGDRIAVTAPNVFTDKKTMRVMEIQYSTNTDTFSLEEDSDRGTA